MKRVRAFLGIEALAFWMASLVHAGFLLRGYQHRQAMIAEGVIGAGLALGLLLILVHPRSTRSIGSVVQAFALLGTLVGIFTIVIGIGPQSGLDVGLHAMFVILLVAGMTVAGAGDRRPVYDL
jgi:membrane-associated HD superfamily phosphohydrolase